MIERYSPTSLCEISDQDTAKQVLTAIANSPVDSPKIIVISGPDGTGKTVVSKAFARELINSNCLSDYSLSFYREYNANTFDCEASLEVLESLPENYNVVNIEYIDKMPMKLQVKLLDIIEKSNKKTFFVLCTNDNTKVLASIKNRAMTIDLTCIDSKIIREKLEHIIKEEGREVSKEDLNKIILRANGSMRDAITLLDKLLLLGTTTFEDVVCSSRVCLIKFLIASFLQDKDNASKVLTQLLRFPLLYIKEDYEALILEIMQVRVKTIQPIDMFIKTLYENFASNRVLDLFKIMNDNILYNMFETEDELKSAMWYIYIQIGKLNK